MGRWLPLLVLATSGLARAVVAPCPAPATVRILAENRSADDTVSLRVRGELLSADSNTCGGGGPASYDVTLTCAGSGTVSCGTLPAGIQPGLWVHHVDVQVTGSDPQHQSQRSVVLASTAGVSNVVVWTVFSRTFVVHQAENDDFRNQLDLAAAFTASGPDVRALVTFDRSTFPGASNPTEVPIGFDRGPPKVCVTDTCGDSFKAAHCLTGSRITVDALDDLGERGGVVLVNGTCERYLLRIYGSDNVLRGLDLRGIEVDPNKPSTAVVDTVAIVGSDSQRNRIEQCIVRGGLGDAAGRGDALSVGDDAGMPGGADHDAVIVDSEVTGAQDKGIKVVGGGHATVQTSCVHDNMNGGIQATEGGNVTAIRNVVQLNRLGPSQNGLLVGVPDEIGAANTMATDGNVVRFSGARGISVVNAGSGVLTNDFVAENQQSGIRIETTIPQSPPPAAQLRGVGLACNHKRVLGTCFPSQAQVLCTQNSDCAVMTTCSYPPAGEPAGLGVSVGFGLSNGTDLCTAGGCRNPLVDLGTGGNDAGRNALAQNPNPTTSGGVNLSNQLAPAGPPIPARGNQWQDCGMAPTCSVAQVQMLDLLPPNATAADIGTPTGQGGGPAPTITRIVPARPRAGDFVRVYNGSLAGLGGTFNAIDAVACTASTPPSGDPNGAPVGLPSDPCSPESPETVTQNHTLNRGNRVAIALGGHGFDVDVHAVTPTMLIFQMPIDCFAAGTLTMTRGNDAPSAAVPFCDPGGCADSPAGAPCDDGNACTQDDHCDGNGACVPGSPLVCGGPCQTCDPQSGCVPKGDGTACSNGDPCTEGDHCSGTTCVPGTPVTCAGPCLTGACIPGAGCQPRPASTSCDNGTACTVGDHCSGTDGTCVAGALSCDDGNSCTADACDAVRGCTHAPLPDGTLCPAIDQCHGPALCQAGVCNSGPELQCSDGDFCTDDLCDPQQGCVYPPVTGIRRTSCRIDELGALLQSVPDAAMQRRLARRLNGAGAALAKLQAATHPKQVRRLRTKARVVLRGFLGAVRRGSRVLGPNLERQLERSVKTAIGTLTPS